MQRNLFLLATALSCTLLTKSQTNTFPPSGSVGIGTTSPQQRLHVEGSGNQAIFVSTSSLSGTSGSGMIGYVKSLPNAANQRLGFFLLGSRGGGQSAFNAAGMVGYTDAAWTAGSSYPAYLAFETTPSGSATRLERMRIKSNGFVAIGNTNPALGGFIPNALLHVNSITGENPFRVQVAGASKLFVSSGGGVSVGSSITPPENGLFVSGNTGIGTFDPVVKLQVAGGSDAGPAGGGFVVVGSSTGANIAIDDNEIMGRTNGVASALFLNHNGGDLIITGTNEAGNTGIGTSSPGSRLHVRQSSANRAIVWQHQTAADNWSVGIGTNTLNCRFEFNGILKGQISSVDGSFISGSDLNLKDEIEPISNLTEKVMKLKPSTYYYKDSRQYAKNKSIGFVAQDVEKIFPEMVYAMDGGYKGISYSAFAVVAIKVIQEQQENITEQEKKLTEQGETIVDLQQRVDRLEAAIAGMSGRTSMGDPSGAASIAQNSPNPFKGSTVLRYSIPAGNQGLINIYDEEGKLVKSMNASASGQTQINARDFAAGTYVYTLTVNGKLVGSKKMAVLK